MQTAKIGTLDFSYPTEISELSKPQYLFLVRAYFSKMDMKQVRIIYFLSVLYRNKKVALWLFKNLYLIPFVEKITGSKMQLIQEVMDDNSWEELLRIVNQVFQSFSQDKFLQNIYPTLRVGFLKLQKLKGPADELKNICFYQFRIIDFYYCLFLQTKDQNYLNKMIAAMYAIELSETEYQKQLERKSKQIEKINPVTKQVIFRFYADCRANLVEKHPDLFEKKSDGEFTVQKVIEQYNNWGLVPVNLAEKPDQISVNNRIQIWDMFAFLNKNAKQIKEMKRKQKA